jgi:hypothetical protein
MPRYTVEPGTGRIIREEALLTQREFMKRWRESGAGAVLSMLFALEVKDSAAGAQAREWLTEFRTARGIDPLLDETATSTDAALSFGIAAGVITSAQAAAARPLILAPVPDPPQWNEE